MATGLLALTVLATLYSLNNSNNENIRLSEEIEEEKNKTKAERKEAIDLRMKYDEVLAKFEEQDSKLTEMEKEVKTYKERNEKLMIELNKTKEELKKAKQTASVSRGTSVSSRSNINTAVGTGTPVGTFNATYYGMDCNGCSGRTASGFNTKGRTHYNGLRILAGDTSILPLGTIVYVEGSAIGSFKGIVLDRGGAIKGHKLDILVGSEAESSKLGRQNVKVSVISYGDNRYRKID